ncbi:hypothetical protein N657DRAFT_644706 [Parathielavia appendiculata]|uniref:Uncharacterized protein n=1 Tax=Parathielavia appendiculata TaxID=2587402 RepID=A0AAN6U1I8_9PEZI|nr:hypothetical protein N657DRAFT_644706 [Parathielavia appendiculata]
MAWPIAALTTECTRDAHRHAGDAPRDAPRPGSSPEPPSATSGPAETVDRIDYDFANKTGIGAAERARDFDRWRADFLALHRIRNQPVTVMHLAGQKLVEDQLTANMSGVEELPLASRIPALIVARIPYLRNSGRLVRYEF